jgi:hypothetical protein
MCPLIDEWIKKINVHNGMVFSHLKKELSFAAAWMNK